MSGPRAPVFDPLGAFDGSTFLRNAVLFTRALRSAGVVTDLGGALDFARALTLVDLGDRAQVQAAGSAIFCRRRLDRDVYDAVFDQFWRRHSARIAPARIEDGPRREQRGVEALHLPDLQRAVRALRRPKWWRLQIPRS